MTADNQLLAAIEKLKVTHSDTRALYNAVCHLLFFEYGIAPTGRKLYEYVKRGSMSVPGEELAKFWEEVRSKGRVNVTLPGIPDSVSRPAADAIAAIWLQATDAARAELASSRREQERLTAQALADQAAAEEARQFALRAAEDLQVRLNQANAALDAAREALDAERRALAGAHGRINELLSQLDQTRAHQERLQESFSSDLALARQDVVSAQERAAASERRALREIEQERQARARADKRADSLQERLVALEAKERQSSLEHAEERTRATLELEAKHQALLQATASHQILRAQHDATVNQLASSQEALATALQSLAASQAEAQTLRQLIDRFSQPSPALATPPGRTTTRKAKGP